MGPGGRLRDGQNEKKKCDSSREGQARRMAKTTMTMREGRTRSMALFWMVASTEFWMTTRLTRTYESEYEVELHCADGV